MPAIPKPESALARPRSRKGKDQQSTLHGVRRPLSSEYLDREAPEDWHPIARDLWNSIKTSGQIDFMQDTDVVMVWSLCDDLSLYKKAGKRSSMMFSAIHTAMGSLLFTEGDRRRVRMELGEAPVEKPNLHVIGQEQYAGVAEG